MNRRGTRVREYYGYALVAGISVEQARRMFPGFIRDMYQIRLKYDAQMSVGKIGQRLGL